MKKLLALLIGVAIACSAQTAPKPVTLQISMSQEDYDSIAEMVSRMTRTTIEPIPGKPDQQQAKTTPVFGGVEEYLAAVIQRAVQADVNHHGTARTQAARDELTRKAQDLQETQRRVDQAARPATLGVTKK